ncbi:hypothetical protein CC85DRAFT_156603 [Cutaneotrichosporon oleaginosum]|uniref:Uncharacterized protein n=1 Tax=Cutaneotrichosporon oleaginosum TaxID=879819 RepID=A0A0J0XGZ5_9TREE|nr:uncharacterized protein CC85DRAFT_156603 [Cutaneotrichosporon oleaginosum]KLT40328.1 hypothetical protein CC85DRAFT_156603 [Cutaneotrichosporon oleaginosum]TXT06507.1 hypothetical protein COLE_05838 [Cutaneotrichosporon oleaginosum]
MFPCSLPVLSPSSPCPPSSPPRSSILNPRAPLRLHPRVTLKESRPKEGVVLERKPITRRHQSLLCCSSPQLRETRPSSPSVSCCRPAPSISHTHRTATCDRRALTDLHYYALHILMNTPAQFTEPTDHRVCRHSSARTTFPGAFISRLVAHFALILALALSLLSRVPGRNASHYARLLPPNAARVPVLVAPGGTHAPQA